jgi:hypothetical protein
MGIDRLYEIGVEAGLHGVDAITGGAETRDGDEPRRGGKLFTDEARDLAAVHFGQGDVEHGDIGPFCADAAQGRGAVISRCDDLKAQSIEEHRQSDGCVPVVVGHDNREGAAVCGAHGPPGGMRSVFQIPASLAAAARQLERAERGRPICRGR